jgi:hypothetical protein
MWIRPSSLLSIKQHEVLTFFQANRVAVALRAAIRGRDLVLSSRRLNLVAA